MLNKIILPYYLSFGRASPAQILHVLCEWKYPPCGLSRACRPTSAAARRVRNGCTGVQSFPFPWRSAAVSLFSPRPRSCDAVALNMSNTPFVNCWWRSKVTIWSELWGLNLPISRHICQQSMSNAHFPRTSVCCVILYLLKVQTMNEILSLWNPTDCAISCKLAFFSVIVQAFT